MPRVPRKQDDAYEQATVPVMVTRARSLMRYRVGHFVVTLPDGNVIERTIDLPHVQIGSAPKNDICIPDSSVSRHHCEIRHTPEGFFLRDLESTNGIWVAGIRVKEALIQGETVLRLGRSSLKFVPTTDERSVEASQDVRFGDLFGRSQTMREIFGVLEKVSSTDLTVTVQGETGTGKDLVARAIHQASPRRNGPFVVFDAGAVASNLIESELFGHEKGAFTGATDLRKGAFESADGGTLFIDEIGELALDLQPRLLRALEQREIQRVGGNRRIPVDVRVICATNRALGDEVRQGRFREDLFFRISVVVLTLPLLRDRREDIELLAEALMRKINPGMRPAADVIQVLQGHDWPGNVRELRNVLEAACALCQEPELHARHLIFAHDRNAASGSAGERAASLAGRTLGSIEKAAISQTLEDCQGNRSAAARILGIAPSTLYLKLKRYGLS